MHKYLLQDYKVVPYTGKYPERVREWAYALLSGRYRQAVGRLHDKTGAMCCLGVACDISLQGKWISDLNDMTFGYQGIQYSSGTEASRYSLTKEVRDWLDLDENKHILVKDDEGVHYADLNDAYNLTFEEIAKIILESIKDAE